MFYISVQKKPRYFIYNVHLMFELQILVLELFKRYAIYRFSQVNYFFVLFGFAFF